MKNRMSVLPPTLLLLLLLLLPLSAGAADLPFTDVPPASEYRDTVQYVYDNGLMNGVGEGKFAPEEPFTRAMFVTILGRMEGIDPANYPDSSFSDVPATRKSLAWAAPYIQWAAENSIVNGVGDGKFNPNGAITREQYSAIVLRYFISMEGKINANPPVFVYLKDSDRVSTYAREAVRSLVGYGLIDPGPDQTFLPKAAMTRGEITRTFARIHALRTTGTVPQSLLTGNTPYWLLFGVPAGEVGEYAVLEGREPTYTPEDSYFTITQKGCVSTGFHNGYENTDCLLETDVSRSGVYTTRGISVGSTRAEVRAAYPDHLYAGEFSPYTGDYLWYNRDSALGYGWNLLFWFENDRVSRILALNYND